MKNLLFSPVKIFKMCKNGLKMYNFHQRRWRIFYDKKRGIEIIIFRGNKNSENSTYICRYM